MPHETASRLVICRRGNEYSSIYALALGGKRVLWPRKRIPVSLVLPFELPRGIGDLKKKRNLP